MPYVAKVKSVKKNHGGFPTEVSDMARNMKVELFTFSLYCISRKTVDTDYTYYSWCMTSTDTNTHVCEVSNLLFTSSTSKGNFTYLYLTDLDKLLQSMLQTPYTATRVKNLIELGVITRNPKTLFKDNLPRKIWQFTFLHAVHFRSNANNVNR